MTIVKAEFSMAGEFPNKNNSVPLGPRQTLALV